MREREREREREEGEGGREREIICYSDGGECMLYCS